MSTYKVKKYEPMKDANLLVDEDTNEEISVDLIVSGELGDKEPEDLVGERVEIGRLAPYLMIGNDIEVL